MPELRQTSCFADTGQLTALRRPLHRRLRPRYLSSFWNDPPYIPSATNQLIGECIGACGARNVFGSLPILAPQVAVESVLAARTPDMIVRAEMMAPKTSIPAQAMAGHVPQMRAVRTGS